MHTACVRTIHASMPLDVTSEGAVPVQWDPMLGGEGGKVRVSLYGKVQYIMGNGHRGPHTLWEGWLTDGQTRLKTLPSYNLVGGR